jgi:stage V sporulation protein B
LPSISYSIKKDNIDNAIRKIKVIFKVALLIILPCIVLFIIFPEQIISIVFGQLNNTYINELQISSIMLRISSLGILYLTVYQLTTAILQAKDLYYKPCIALGFAVLVKIVISVILLLNTNVNFFAINIANVVCYIISAFINLYYFDKEFKIEISYRNLFVVPMASCAVMVCCIWFLIGVIGSFLPAVISSIIAFVIGGVIYCWLVISFKAVKIEELLLIKKKS